jgi:hypothetical protein
MCEIELVSRGEFLLYVAKTLKARICSFSGQQGEGEQEVEGCKPERNARTPLGQEENDLQ